MALSALLLDLDDTLLGNSMDVFLPAYFQALTSCVDHLIPADRLLGELLRATEVMNASDGDGPTNEQVFAAAFYSALRCDQGELEPVFEEFYAEEFPKLQHLTRRRTEARKLVKYAFERGLQVAIATNPLFPRVAVEQRLAWAGVPAAEFDYALVTTYENMHATKSHPAYYREILQKLDMEPGECLMVGDDWEKDVVRAASVGILVYWIAESDDVPPAQGVPLVGQGTLADFWDQLKAGSLAVLD